MEDVDAQISCPLIVSNQTVDSVKDDTCNMPINSTNSEIKYNILYEETKSFKSNSLCTSNINGTIAYNNIDKILNAKSFNEIKQYCVLFRSKYRAFIQKYYRQIQNLLLVKDCNSLRKEISYRTPNNFIGYELIVTTGDGSCFYHAVSLSLFGNESHSHYIRACHLFCLIEYEDYFRYIFYKFGIGNGESFEDFLCKHTHNSQWANELNQLAVAIMINRPIHIITFLMHNGIMWPYNIISPNQPLFIVLDQNHFSAFIPIDQNSIPDLNAVLIYNNGPMLTEILQYTFTENTDSVIARTRNLSLDKRPLSTSSYEDISSQSKKTFSIHHKTIPFVIDKKLADNEKTQNRRANQLQKLSPKENDFSVELENINEREGVSITAYLSEKEKRRIRDEQRKTKSKTYRCGYIDQNELSKLQSIPEFKLSAMDQVCAHCNALYFNEERNTRGLFVLCCQNGNYLKISM